MRAEECGGVRRSAEEGVRRRKIKKKDIDEKKKILFFRNEIYVAQS